MFKIQGKWKAHYSYEEVADIENTLIELNFSTDKIEYEEEEIEDSNIHNQKVLVKQVVDESFILKKDEETWVIGIPAK